MLPIIQAMSLALWRVLLACCLATGGLAGWGATRLGSPVDVHLHLPNFTALNVAALRQHQPHKPSRPLADELYEALAAATAANGLSLDEDTLTDGNCGLDALLRNVERMNLDIPFATQLLGVLHNGGRLKAVHALRLKLLVWIRHHLDDVIFEGFRLRDLVTLDPEYSTLDRYYKEMRLPGTWIDTPMLLAASATFGVQIICFTGTQGEPQLVAAPEIQHAASAPVMTIANIGNYHYYAVHPLMACEDGPPDERDQGDSLPIIEDNPASERFDVVACVDNSGAPGGSSAHWSAYPVNTTVFGICESVAHWDPWSSAPPSGPMLEFINGLEAGGAPPCLEMLRWRRALKLWQIEQSGADGLDRDVVFSRSYAWMNKQRRDNGDKKLFRKTGREQRRLDPYVICKALAQPCSRAKNDPHACLKHFRQCPVGVLGWRKVFYTLPRADRLHRVVDMYRRHLTGGPTDPDAPAGVTRKGTAQFSMEYKFGGCRVCRQAFMQLTGINTCFLQTARSTAWGNATIAAGKISNTLNLWAMRKPLKTLGARAWLLQYAKTHGDASPMHPEIFLPTADKAMIYSVYLQNMIDRRTPQQDIASYTRFLEAWNRDLGFIKMRTMCGPFTHCGLCDYLKMLTSTMEDVLLREAVLRKLSAHWEFQSAQRLVMNNLFEESATNPTKLVCLSWDKMDQVKTMIPRVKQLANTNYYKIGPRITVSLLGVHAPSVFPRPLFYTLLEDFEHGGTRSALP